MPTMTLESLKAAVRAKYEPLTIDMGEAGSFDLIMPLRLPEEDLRALTKCQAEFNKIQDSVEEPVDEDGKPRPLTPEEEEAAYNIRPQLIEKLRELLTIPADNKELCRQWLALVGDDLAALSVMVEQYQDSSQVGEA